MLESVRKLQISSQVDAAPAAMDRCSGCDDRPEPHNILYKQQSTRTRTHSHAHALLACSDPIAKQVYYDLQGLDRR